MPWFAMNASLYVLSHRPPINLATYVQDELKFDVTSSDFDHEFRDLLAQQMADETGVPRGLVQATAEGKPYEMTPLDWLQIVEPYRRGLVKPDDADHQTKARLDLLAALPPAELEKMRLSIEGEQQPGFPSEAN